MPGLWTRWTGTRALLMSGLACGLGCGGGTGLDAMSVAFEQDGACLGLTADVADGASEPALTYSQVCPDPVGTPCIELDQAMRFPRVPSGALHVGIDGFIGGRRCYVGDATVTVPTSGALHRETLFLVPTSAPGCP